VDDSGGWISFTDFALICHRKFGIGGKELKKTLPNLIKMGFVETKDIGGEPHYRITKKGDGT